MLITHILLAFFVDTHSGSRDPDDRAALPNDPGLMPHSWVVLRFDEYDDIDDNKY